MALSNLFVLLLRLKQESMVKDYRERFKCYAGVVEMADQRYLKMIFLNRLKEEITTKLSLHSFDTSKELIAMAKKVDE